MNPFLVIGLVGAGVYIFSRLETVGAASRLNYVFKSIGVEFKSAWLVQINIDIDIQNPTSTSFTINSMTGNLSLNDNFIGNLSNFTATEIKGNTQTAYRIALQLNTLSLPSTILDMFNNFSGITAKVTGTVNVDNLNVPIELSYKAL